MFAAKKVYFLLEKNFFRPPYLLHFPMTFWSTTSTPEFRGPDRCKFEQKALASLKEPKSYPRYLGLKTKLAGSGNAPNVAHFWSLKE